MQSATAQVEALLGRDTRLVELHTIVHAIVHGVCQNCMTPTAVLRTIEDLAALRAAPVRTQVFERPSTADRRQGQWVTVPA